MPLYEYECESCGIRFERKERMTAEPLKVCPECDGAVHRVIQPVGIIFKGSGFYCTDHRGTSGLGSPAKKDESSEGDSSADTSPAPSTPKDAS